MPLGATAGIAADVRVIAATHRDLPAMVRAGEFREDLFYRLNVASVRLPPLRDRMDDIPVLVHHALEELARVYEEEPRTVTDAAMVALRRHNWPGNVRELINAIEHALVFSKAGDALDVDDLPVEVRASRGTSRSDGGSEMMTLEASERALIAETLRHAAEINRRRRVCWRSSDIGCAGELCNINCWISSGRLFHASHKGFDFIEPIEGFPRTFCAMYCDGIDRTNCSPRTNSP